MLVILLTYESSDWLKKNLKMLNL